MAEPAASKDVTLLASQLRSDGTEPPLVKRRPAPGAYGADYTPATEEEWSPEDLGERPVSDKRLSECMDSVSSTVTMLFVAVLSVGAMFFIAVSLMLGAGNVSVMMR